jgi:hypothetical protein
MGSLVNVIFFYREHSFSFRAVSKIYNDSFGLEECIEVVRISELEKRIPTSFEYKKKRIFFIITPPEMCILSLPNQDY